MIIVGREAGIPLSQHTNMPKNSSLASTAEKSWNEKSIKATLGILNHSNGLQHLTEAAWTFQFFLSKITVMDINETSSNHSKFEYN